MLPLARPPVTAPYGSWHSPISADLIASAGIRLGQIALAGRDIFWLEGRPEEQGRNVLVWWSADGAVQDLTGAPYNVRSRAHEYGGGALAVSKVAAYFTNDDDQQVYRLGARRQPRALTRTPGARHADLVVDSRRRRLIAVREQHTPGAEPVNSLVAIDVPSGAAQPLATGHDFYASPCLSPDGRRLAWLSWDHPNMPWDGSELWCATIGADGSLDVALRIAGGPDESIFQPSWSPQGELHFVSDRSGWWNLYRQRDGVVEALQPMAAEFGVPQWAFGMSTYGFDGRGRIVCTYWQDGDAHLAMLDAEHGSFEAIETPYRDIAEVRVGHDYVVLRAAGASSAEAIVRIDLGSGEQHVLRSSSAAPVDARYVSTAEAIAFPTGDGLEAHAFFYAPRNRDFRAPDGERPPLIVMTHGGPTGAASAALKWGVQYWTSRGLAVVDVNYGGSSGHGRAYRARLDGNGGIVDVDDAVNAAQWLAERGRVDAERLAIRGSSAGGYTTLAALTFRKAFKAGTSLYGVSDLEALARDTHKFESRYLERLVGPYPAARERYRERSPIHAIERLASALLVLQGAEDKVVPPSQAETMVEALRAKGLPVAYLLFEHEQHGFRRAETIRRALEAELFFYGRVLGFTPADTLAPLAIDNLPATAL
jgi:dipeptidyl aminopeptidase/acylaminoacyl peptidase